jgi:uncharacterized membrane protein YfcA
LGDFFWTIPLLFATGTIAGFIDSIAGGGGLITLPVLLSIGLPAQDALGTNKFQSSFGSLTASVYHIRKKNVNLRDAWWGILFTFSGAAFGAWVVQQVETKALGNVIPFMLAGILIYTLMAPKFGEDDSPPRMNAALFYPLIGTGFGFYDGFFGPGVGSFWAIAFIVLLGFDLRRATGYTRLMNFTSNVASLLTFAAGKHVVLAAGLAMAAGQVLGSRLGSGIVIHRGASVIRPVFVAVVAVMIVKLIYDRFWMVR